MDCCQATFDTPRCEATDLPDRDAAVLAELAREGEARVAFQGLRRRLGLHQQALVRTLRRLADEGYVVRDHQGYGLTDRGFATLRCAPTPAPAGEVLAVAQALLPPHVDAATLTSRLARRWFDGLRWYGLSEAPGETTLTWLTDPGNRPVRVRIAGGALTLEVEAAPGGAWDGAAALRAVLLALAEAYADAPPARPPGTSMPGSAAA